MLALQLILQQRNSCVAYIHCERRRAHEFSTIKLKPMAVLLRWPNYVKHRVSCVVWSCVLGIKTSVSALKSTKKRANGFLMRNAAKMLFCPKKASRTCTEILQEVLAGWHSVGTKLFSLMNRLPDCLGHVENHLFPKERVRVTMNLVRQQQWSILIDSRTAGTSRDHWRHGL